MLQKLRVNSQGFTLIELMIVIAILAILAAIAVPNYISYSNKIFCSAAESDAISIAAAVSEYFSVPINTTVDKAALGGTNAASKVYVGALLSNKNTWTIDASDLNNIEIVVRDVTSRCPEDYRDAMDLNTSPRGYWTGNTYVKRIKIED